MDGLLNVLKPVGMTSFDVVSLIRRWTGTRRVGHTGTLDPDAAGVLVVCVGKATRAVEVLTEKDKDYRAELCLGIETDTQDATGSVLRSVVPCMPDERILEAVRGMAGNRMQMPPMYSALKVDGRKLYELAREGKVVERACRPVSISRCEPLTIRRDADRIRVLLDVTCSKGTYIRTLCHDIGMMLDCGGHMSFLIRTRSGPFRLGEAVSLEQLAQAAADGTVGQLLIPVDRAFAGIPAVCTDPGTAARLMNGQTVPLSLVGDIRMEPDEETGAALPATELPIETREREPEPDFFRVYTGSRFLGLGRPEAIAEAGPAAGFRLFRQLQDE
jgi:tRNA pseudouridine55 synthase